MNRDKLRTVVSEKLQPYSLVGLLGKALKQTFAEEFANLQRPQPHLKLPSDHHAVGTIDDDRQPEPLTGPELEGGDVARPPPVGLEHRHLVFVPASGALGALPMGVQPGLAFEVLIDRLAVAVDALPSQLWPT